MNTRDLLLRYAQVGIIQFGNFPTETPPAPVAFQFLLLPSFPVLMKSTVEALVPFFSLNSQQDRFMTTRNTIALGGVLATYSGMPMLFPHGPSLDYTGAFAIEGTADVGNPITLLTDVLMDGANELELAVQAKRVGLPVERVVAILDTERAGRDYLQQKGQISAVDSLFSLTTALDWLLDANIITARLWDAVQRWQHS